MSGNPWRRHLARSQILAAPQNHWPSSSPTAFSVAARDPHPSLHWVGQRADPPHAQTAGAEHHHCSCYRYQCFTFLVHAFLFDFKLSPEFVHYDLQKTFRPSSWRSLSPSIARILWMHRARNYFPRGEKSVPLANGTTRGPLRMLEIVPPSWKAVFASL